MKNEKFFEAMENINDELIFSAMEEPAAGEKTRPFRKIKWTVLAACLALLLAVPAGAYMLGFTIYPNDASDTLDVFPNERISINDLSEEVKNVTENTDLTFESIEEAENYIGITFPQNDMLDNAVTEKEAAGYAEGEIPNHYGLVYIHIGYNDGKILTADATLTYVKESSFTVSYAVVPEDNPYENGGGYGIRTEDIIEREGYTTSSGRICEIIKVNKGENRYMTYGITEVDGILVMVRAFEAFGKTAKETVTEVLEAYN